MVEWLQVPWAFYAIAVTMVSVAIVMLAYFKRKGWL
jgi:Mg2+ and Co2+ transporter CorA